MIPLVDDCVAAGMTLAADQCYGFKIPPVHYGLLADIYKQTKDLPHGTPLKAVITDCAAASVS